MLIIGLIINEAIVKARPVSSKVVTPSEKDKPEITKFIK